MITPARRHMRWAVLALGLLALAAWLLPGYFGAGRYRRRLEAGLEGVLHRPVTFGWASFRLLPRPGFSVDNVIVHENPAFGSEPFARIDRVDCELRWGSLWHRRFEFVRLRLDHPSLNVVRNLRGQWNLENFLLQSGLGGPKGGLAPGRESLRPIEVVAEDGRLNFKIGADKKPFAIVGLRTRLNLDPVAGRIQFQASGNPMRSDLPLPTPGLVEISGEWRPGPDMAGILAADLRTRESLLYNWVPLVSGQNPGIYGVVDADARIRGSLQSIKFEGDASVTQFHRWELLPPTDSTPLSLRFRGEFDRGRKRLLLESVEGSFASTRLHMTGAVENLPDPPGLDLVVALERARLEELQALSSRLWHIPSQVGLAGRMDGLLAIQGPWRERRYGGFFGAREVRLAAPSGTFAVSDLALRIDKAGARLAPATIRLAPRLALVAEGAIFPADRQRPAREALRPARYEMKLSARSFELSEAVRLARGWGFWSAERLDAQGIGNASVLIAGTAWPLSRPSFSGKAEVRAARVLVPGLTEPLNIPRAHLQIDGDHLVIDSLTAVIGSSVFTGRLGHQGPKGNPWWFDLKASALRVEEGALWFDVLGHRPPLPLLDRIPGLSSLTARRSAASGLFTALNARGRFETPHLTYRSVSLQDFQASVELAGRVLRMPTSSFQAGGGRGKGSAELDLTASPAKISGEVTLTGIKLVSLASRLPVAVRKAHGFISGTARFETRGLTRSEMSSSLQGEGRAHLERIGLGDFDPLLAISRQGAGGEMQPARGEVVVQKQDIDFSVRARRIYVTDQKVNLEGARLYLIGSWGFDGTLDLGVEADLRHIARSWGELPRRGNTSSAQRVRLRISGPVDHLVARSEGVAAQASR